jgi:hypothetical protein
MAPRRRERPAAALDLAGPAADAVPLDPQMTRPFPSGSSTAQRDDFAPLSPRPGQALVTGGAGFIGSHVVERLLATGYATGPDEFNQLLSERRADAVVTFLREQGADTSRFVVKGFGDANPRSDDPFDPANRRVETRIIQ